MEPTIIFFVVIFVLGYVAGKVASGDHSAASRNLGGSNQLPSVLTQGSNADKFYRDAEGKGSLAIPDGFETRITMLLRDRKKIQAIKEIRTVTGLGLYEAKSIADHMDRGRTLKELLPDRYPSK